MDVKNLKTNFAGRDLVFESGKLAGQANAAVTMTYGGTVVLATVVVGKEPREGVDFFPLLVDYEERLYAAGKISGSRFIKREGRPSEEAILTCRLIDRPIRPLFPKSFRKDVQIIITVLSIDHENDPDIVALNAASTALMMTKEAPFEGPVAAIRVGYIDEQLVINPTKSQMENSKLDLVLAINKDKVMMIEASAKEVSEELVNKAIEFAKEQSKEILNTQIEFAKEAMEAMENNVEAQEDKLATLEGEITDYIGAKIMTAIKSKTKEERQEQLDKFLADVLANFEGNYKQIDIKNHFDKLLQKSIRKAVLEENHRIDGRALDEIRPISIEVGLLPRTHGTGLFTRGQTQVLTVATLAGPGMQQMVDTMTEEGQKRYMHHYNFPPYSTGEVSPLRGASRREIGHGALAEKALVAVIPTKEDFPYTIRLVSEVLSSNGSSSMASVCGSTLALMDAGVPISAPVAGIAMGLVTSDDGKQYKVLTDIQGLEDFGGDMDFKVAGTKNGITAIQMDTKIKGLSKEVIEETFENAKKARLEILEKITKVISEPRKELSPFAPKIISIKINPEKIGNVIGPGGKMINKIITEAGGKENISIDIEEDGVVQIASINPESANMAKAAIEALVIDVEAGQIYTGKVINIQKDRNTGKEIGAIVEVLPGKEGMVHISQIANERIEKVSDKLKIGDEVKVKVAEIDKEKGRIRLTMKF